MGEGTSAGFFPDAPCPECGGRGQSWLSLGNHTGVLLQDCPKCSGVGRIPNPPTEDPPPPVPVVRRKRRGPGLAFFLELGLGISLLVFAGGILSGQIHLQPGESVPRVVALADVIGQNETAGLVIIGFGLVMIGFAMKRLLDS